MDTIRQQLVDYLLQADTQLAAVEGAADIEAVLSDGAPTPAAYILRGANKRSDNGRTETIRDAFLVVLVVSNVRGARGEDSSDEAEILSNQVENWFKTFKPDFFDAAERATRFLHFKLTGGRNMRWTDQKLLWADTYELKYARRCC